MLVRKAEGIYGDFVGADAGIYPNLYFFIPVISWTTKSLLILSTLQSQPGYSKQSLAGAQLSVIVPGLSRMESASHSSPCRAGLCTGSWKVLVAHQCVGTAEQHWHSTSTASATLCSPPPAGWGWTRGWEETQPGQLTHADQGVHTIWHNAQQ